MWQCEKYIASQVFHENVSQTDFSSKIAELLPDFAQVQIVKKEKIISLRLGKDGKVKRSATLNQKALEINLQHDKEKNYLFCEGENIPVLQELGIFNKENKIVKAMFDKYKQINRFIEIIDDEMKNFDKKSITILDFGCGKSYLTFLLYYYFSVKRKIDVKIKGYDLKEDVIKSCNNLAKKYGYNNLEFVLGDVAKEKIDFDVDMIISLHACDTATDYALYNAIKNNVKYIFSVPCCQHELNKQIKANDEFDILMRHGLIKERFSALLTDAIRCEILKMQGYEVDVIEFVDFAHSPKNLMIRAVKKSKPKYSDKVKLMQDKFKIKQKLFELVYGDKQST